MSENQRQNIAEKHFWNSWSHLKANIDNNATQSQTRSTVDAAGRRAGKDHAESVSQQLAKERRNENLKLLAMVLLGILATGLIVYILGLVDVKNDNPTTTAKTDSHQPAKPTEEEVAAMEASIEEEMVKGGFTTKEAYFSSELTKQAHDVSDELNEFSKKIKQVSPKFNVTGMVIEGKLGQITKDEALNGFGIEVVIQRNGESDDVSLISHLKGMSSPVEFFAEGGRVVAHFKDYPPSYCAGTKGAAICGS